MSDQKGTDTQKVSIPLTNDTLSKIAEYQKVYRELKGTVISRGAVIDRVFLKGKKTIDGWISEMKEAIEKKESI